MIPKPCLRCRRPTDGGSYCSRCEPRVRRAAQPYRRAYSSSIYQANRAIRMKRARGRCEAVVDGARCENAASETHHVIPLSQARSYEEALALCDWPNLRAVCWRHNPRGSS